MQNSVAFLLLNSIAWRLCRVLLAAFLAGGCALAQTWIQLLPPDPKLSPRNVHSAVYDTASNRMIIFGAGNGGFSNDVWVLTSANGLNGPSTWIHLNPRGTPPAPRFGQSAIYDPATNRMVIFGGTIPGMSLNDVWVLTNANGLGGVPTWIQLQPLASLPAARRFLQAAYDPGTNRMIIFGGCLCVNQSNPGDAFNDVWVLSNANGVQPATPTWLQLSPTGVPPHARSDYALAFNSVTNRLILFGGGGPDPNLVAHEFNDVWILTNANGIGTSTWTNTVPDGAAGNPLARAGPTSIYDSVTDRFTIFGGVTACRSNFDCDYQNDVWTLTNADGLPGSGAWQQLRPSGVAPLPRQDARATYDSASNRMTIFGGGQHASASLFNDSWVLTNANGIAGSQVGITQVLPNHGGNAGTATVQIIGSGFQAGAAVKLGGIGPDIVSSNVNVANTSGITATFTLTGAAPGVRNLVVTNPDATSATLAGGFTVEQGGAPNIQVNIIGRNAIRFGRAQPYYVQVVNTGNVDSPPGLVSLSLPSMIAVQQMNGADLFIAGNTSDPEFGVPQPIVTAGAINSLRAFASTGSSGTSQILLSATSGVPAGGSQTGPVSLTLPFNVASSNFTVTTAWQSSVTNLPFDQYLANINAPYITFQAGCLQCYSQAVAQVNAITDAQTAYTAWQVAQQDLSSEDTNLSVSVGSILVQSAVITSLALSAPEALALGAVIASGTYLANHILDPASDPDANLVDLDNNILAADRDFLADPAAKALPSVAKLLTLFDVEIALARGLGSINSARGAEQLAWGTFQQKLNQYLSARSAYQSCLSQSCGNPPPPPPPPPISGTTSLMITGVSSLDPNDKIGPAGASSQQFVNGSSPLEYLIDFENQASATAPVQLLSVVDQLAASSFQASTAMLGPIIVNGNQLTPPPGSQAYSGQIDLRPVQSLLVNVTANINATSGLVSWQMAAIDPTTGLPPTNPLVGFLAPGQDGSVSLKSLPNTRLATNAVVSNQASITFDVNPAILTPVWTNTIDSTPPTTRVQVLPPTQTQPAYTVSWSGSDVGSGIAGYSIYRSVDGGPFQLWLADTTATSANDTGQPGHAYAYVSQGVDRVGNTEVLRTVADTSTTIQASACADDATTVVVVQRGGFRLNNATGQFIQNVTLTNAGPSPITGPMSLVLVGLSTNAVLFNKTGSTSCSLPAGSPFIDLGIQTSLAAGQSVTTTLQFTDPTKTGITYNTRVLVRSANR